MSTLEFFFLLMLGIQLAHSIEELANDFHKLFPLFKMSFRFFFSFEIIFFSFWSAIFLFQDFVFRDQFMLLFIFLMLVNGIWHSIWWMTKRKYVPGIYTAPLFILVFLLFHFN